MGAGSFEFNTDDIKFTLNTPIYVDCDNMEQDFSYRVYPSNNSCICTVRNFQLGYVSNVRDILDNKKEQRPVQVTASFTCNCKITSDQELFSEPTWHVMSIRPLKNLTVQEVMYGSIGENELKREDCDAIKSALLEELANPNSQFSAAVKKLLEIYIQQCDKIYNM